MLIINSQFYYYCAVQYMCGGCGFRNVVSFADYIPLCPPSKGEFLSGADPPLEEKGDVKSV